MYVPSSIYRIPLAKVSCSCSCVLQTHTIALCSPWWTVNSDRTLCCIILFLCFCLIEASSWAERKTKNTTKGNGDGFFFCNTKSKKIGIVAALSINAFEGTTKNTSTRNSLCIHKTETETELYGRCAYDLRFSDAVAATTGLYFFIREISRFVIQMRQLRAYSGNA